VREAQGLGAGEYVRKPFTYERLSRAVWDHLHGAKSQNAKKT
jgi:hypothetical protein